MRLTVINVYDLRFIANMESPGIIEGHLEEKIFYIEHFMSYAESLKKFVTQDVLESYYADVIGIRVMYISINEKIKLSNKILGEEMIPFIHKLILKAWRSVRGKPV